VIRTLATGHNYTENIGITELVKNGHEYFVFETHDPELAKQASIK